MFKWPGTPSSRAPENEIADYAELVCWRDGRTSKTAIAADLGRLEENDYTDGVPEEEELPNRVEEAYEETERRKEASRGGYPFTVDRQGYTLRFDTGSSDDRRVVYRYLLLATRLDMRTNRVQANIDGALLLERLSAEVAREYFGERAESIVFGTAAGQTGFRAKVDELCKRLKEGGGFINRGGGPMNVRDGKLDVAVWKHFTDGMQGKLVAFGQCKTGTNYRDELTQLQPDSFCTKWFRSSLILSPVRMFFVSEALSRGHWFNMASDAGLLFDRCRIVDFSEDICIEVLSEVKAWTQAAAQATGLPAP